MRKLGMGKSLSVEVTELGQATGNLYTDSNPTAMFTTATAADHAFEQAGAHRSDVGVAELRDCFTVDEMLKGKVLSCLPGAERPVIGVQRRTQRAALQHRSSGGRRHVRASPPAISVCSAASSSAGWMP